MLFEMLDMWSCLRSYCAKIISGAEAVELEKFKATKSGRPAERYEYKNELSKKKTPSTTAEMKRVRFAETEELISHATQTESCVTVEGEVNNVVRVKVKMTKKQAARILSKCREGGELELDGEVARELEQIIVSNGGPESAVKKFSSALHSHMD